VRLAGIAEPRSVLPMIAEAIGSTGGTDEPLQVVLANRLGRLPTLLILDNLEQLADAAPIVGDLVAQAPRLRILATSQVPLRIGPEVVIQLGPLQSDEAQALFLERVRARDWEFSAQPHEEAVIASVCGRVDGMPLAIELAAARAQSLGLSELERRLEAPLGVLTRGGRDLPARQRACGRRSSGPRRCSAPTTTRCSSHSVRARAPSRWGWWKRSPAAPRRRRRCSIDWRRCSSRRSSAAGATPGAWRRSPMRVASGRKARLTSSWLRCGLGLPMVRTPG
jgi:hypothetical protein